MSAITVNRTKVECSTGDIANQPDLNAIVNAANAELMPGGGVAGAIHRAAGPGLAEECRPLAPVRPGQAVITKGHNLPNAHVIHVLGPVYGRDEPSDALLAACYRNALLLAEAHAIESIGFPSISTGAFGYPMEQAARIAFETIAELVTSLARTERLRFVLFDQRALEIHEEVMREILGKK